MDEEIYMYHAAGRRSPRDASQQHCSAVVRTVPTLLYLLPYLYLARSPLSLSWHGFPPSAMIHLLHDIVRYHWAYKTPWTPQKGHLHFSWMRTPPKLNAFIQLIQRWDWVRWYYLTRSVVILWLYFTIDILILDLSSSSISILKVTNAGTFRFNKEDHTVANLLRMQLLRDPSVRFAGYYHPHPLVRNEVVFLIWRFDFPLGMEI